MRVSIVYLDTQNAHFTKRETIKNRAYQFDTPYFFILFYQYRGDAKIASNASRMA